VDMPNPMPPKANQRAMRRRFLTLRSPLTVGGHRKTPPPPSLGLPSALHCVRVARPHPRLHAACESLEMRKNGVAVALPVEPVSTVPGSTPTGISPRVGGDPEEVERAIGAVSGPAGGAVGAIVSGSRGGRAHGPWDQNGGG
jgi:hypothetical protein